MSSTLTGAQEWRRYFMVPIAAGLGYATSVIHIYGFGPYIAPVQEAFGWSRADVAFGLTIATAINAIFCVPVGRLVDRLGPRMMGLLGVLLTTIAFGLLGTATGDDGNWWLLWFVLAFATLPAQATVWTSTVASRFEVTRGLALAVTLCGASLGLALFPMLATWLIQRYGWRTAFMAEGLIWGAITLPVVLLFFRGAKDAPVAEKAAGTATEPELAGVSIRDGFVSSVFVRLFIASGLFTFTMVSLSYHFVPILTGRGLEAMEAAGVASVIGWCAIAGRLSTGVLLDRYRASLVGAVMFLLPVVACVMFLAGGTSLAAMYTAAVVVGLTLGSEVDVIVYLTTRHFGLRNFGTLYGGLLTALSIGAALGPLAAAAIFDANKSYTLFFWLTGFAMVASSIALLTLPNPPLRFGPAAEPRASADAAVTQETA